MNADKAVSMDLICRNPWNQAANRAITARGHRTPHYGHHFCLRGRDSRSNMDDVLSAFIRANPRLRNSNRSEKNAALAFARAAFVIHDVPRRPGR
ncbi:hypothetical protein [Thermomonas sp.]|uniref:hypothetical protein n=1 Tax=Thermomonas sp. TaxID=1971895 RepID=UPI00260EFD0B|nr:hypothetical protein [Thermomonas sp.]